MKKHLQISSFYTYAPKITIIWCMLPKIRSATDRIFCHFLLFYPILKKQKKAQDSILLHNCTINEDHDVWFLRYRVWCETQNSLTFGLFFPFYTPPPPPTPTTHQNKISKKWKKRLSYIIILHMCTINDDHMMYGSWDMVRDRQIFFSCWAIFALLSH